MNHHEKKSLKEQLLEDIRAGDVMMTPRAYFTLKLAAFTATAGGVLLVSIFIFNFIFFSIRVSGNDALLGFGPHGFEAFARFFPWHLLILDVILIVLLQWLVRHFRFGYRIPILYLVGALILAAFTFGFALDRGTPLNDRLHEGRDRLPPPLGRFYEGAHKGPMKGSGICRCTILAIEGNVLTVEDTREATSTLKVILPSDDRHATSTGLKVGDVVLIAGEEDDGVIRAFGVKKERTDMRFPRNPQPLME